METAIQKLAVISFLILGLSYIAQYRVWAEFFILARSKGEVGVFRYAFVVLPTWILVVSFHNVWTGIPTVLTVLAWAGVLKYAIYFVYPKVGLRSLATVSPEKAVRFRVAGVGMVVVSGLLTFSLVTG